MSIHMKIGGVVLFLFCAWSAVHVITNRSNDHDVRIQLAVEHTQPATISITRSVGGHEHFADITNDNEETVFISLPESWRRDEVRNTPLASVIAGEPSLGYARWQLPPRASVTFRSPFNWHTMIVHNPSDVLLKIRMTTIDLATEQTTLDVYLVQREDLTIDF